LETDIKVNVYREGEVIPEGVSVLYPSGPRHWVYIRHGLHLLVVMIPKNRPEDYKIEEDEDGVIIRWLGDTLPKK
jgi:hypothetical protein